MTMKPVEDTPGKGHGTMVTDWPHGGEGGRGSLGMRAHQPPRVDVARKTPPSATTTPPQASVSPLRTPLSGTMSAIESIFVYMNLGDPAEDGLAETTAETGTRRRSNSLINVRSPPFVPRPQQAFGGSVAAAAASAAASPSPSGDQQHSSDGSLDEITMGEVDATPLVVRGMHTRTVSATPPHGVVHMQQRAQLSRSASRHRDTDSRAGKSHGHWHRHHRHHRPRQHHHPHLCRHRSAACLAPDASYNPSPTHSSLPVGEIDECASYASTSSPAESMWSSSSSGSSPSQSDDGRSSGSELSDGSSCSQHSHGSHGSAASTKSAHAAFGCDGSCRAWGHRRRPRPSKRDAAAVCVPRTASCAAADAELSSSEDDVLAVHHRRHHEGWELVPHGSQQDLVLSQQELRAQSERQMQLQTQLIEQQRALDLRMEEQNRHTLQLQRMMEYVCARTQGVVRADNAELGWARSAYGQPDSWVSTAGARMDHVAIATQQGFIPPSRVGTDRFFGLDAVVNVFNECVVRRMQTPGMYDMQTAGNALEPNFVLIARPGTGRRSLVRTLAVDEMHISMVTLRPDTYLPGYLCLALDMAERFSPHLVYIDEFERLCDNPDFVRELGFIHPTEGQWPRHMRNCLTIVVLGITEGCDHPAVMDRARVLCPTQKIVRVKMPSSEQMCTVLVNNLVRMSVYTQPTTPRQWTQLATAVTNATPADVVAFAERIRRCVTTYTLVPTAAAAAPATTRAGMIVEQNGAYDAATGRFNIPWSVVEAMYIQYVDTVGVGSVRIPMPSDP